MSFRYIKELWNKWDELKYKVKDELQTDKERLNKLRELLDKSKTTGKITKSPSARSSLQCIAREIADTIFRFSDKYPSSSIIPFDPSETKHGDSFTYNHIAKNQLPITGEKLFGREDELAALDKAWDDPNICIFSIVAWGGVGKSALVNHWLERISKNNYRDAERIFGWSFSGRGKSETSSSSEFISRAFNWFGYNKELPNAPIQRGRELATLISNWKTLLILDSLEPLQNENGDIVDPALKELLRGLANKNHGLCVITTRQKITNTKVYPNDSFEQIELENLLEQKGAELLMALGVKGDYSKLCNASKELSGHALSLNLLGTYLRDACGGDVRQRSDLKLLSVDFGQSVHAWQVMARHEEWIKKTKQVVGQNILRLLGFFDRAASLKEIEALCHKPPIKGLTDNLTTVSKEQWKSALMRLQESMLIVYDHTQDTIDVHPLVREYLKEKLRLEFPEACREGHLRLFKYYSKIAKEYPGAEEEMKPLFSAVYHGCNAGEYNSALREILQRRILRWNSTTQPRFFSANTLGLWGDTLLAFRSFFRIPWIKIETVSGFDDTDKAFIFTSTGVCLRALDRFPESIEVMQIGLRLLKDNKEWRDASRTLRSLNQIYIAIGEIEKAQECGKESVNIAIERKLYEEEVCGRARYGESLHHAGLEKLSESKEQFEMAVKKQNEIERQAQTENVQHKGEESINIQPFGGFSVYEYCDLLLTDGDYSKAQQLAEEVRNQENCEENQPLWYGLAHLILGRIKLLEIKEKRLESLEEKERLLKEARDKFEIATDKIDKAEEQQHIPLGLLALAEVYCKINDLDQAEKYLKQTLDISRPYKMRLHEVDANLGYVRYYIACNKNEINKKEYNKKKAKEYLDDANDLVEEIGYNRRKNRIKDLSDSIEKMF